MVVELRKISFTYNGRLKTELLYILTIIIFKAFIVKVWIRSQRCCTNANCSWIKYKFLWIFLLVFSKNYQANYNIQKARCIGFPSMLQGLLQKSNELQNLKKKHIIIQTLDNFAKPITPTAYLSRGGVCMLDDKILIRSVFISFLHCLKVCIWW